jgi:hypothetical protein
LTLPFRFGVQLSSLPPADPVTALASFAEHVVAPLAGK